MDYKRFVQQKRQSLQRLDASRKGSVDVDIQPLVSLITATDQYFTTSSCSGRIILIDTAPGVHKVNCVWLFVSHQACTAEDLLSALSRSKGDAVLKFEPFILHVQCRRLEDARLLHAVAVNSGFRNSGLSVGRTGKIIAAVRSTHGLEVPLSQRGNLLVAPDYIHFLSGLANQKLEENLRRIHGFHRNLQDALSAAEENPLENLLENQEEIQEENQEENLQENPEENRLENQEENLLEENQKENLLEENQEEIQEENLQEENQEENLLEENLQEENQEENPEENQENNPEENQEENPEENPEENQKENQEENPEENQEENLQENLLKENQEENPEENPEEPPAVYTRRRRRDRQRGTERCHDDGSSDGPDLDQSLFS